MKKGEDNILIRLKQTILVFGILIGFCGVTMNDTWSVKVSQTIEESADDDNQSDQVLKSLDAITYSSQINVTHQSVLIEELPEEEIEAEIEIEDSFVVSNISKAFKILFRSIISPNAP
ncbi:MAG: hypothetical protein JXR03_07415 [Cyclobacteriaceae bacterium]